VRVSARAGEALLTPPPTRAVREDRTGPRGCCSHRRFMTLVVQGVAPRDWGTVIRTTSTFQLPGTLLAGPAWPRGSAPRGCLDGPDGMSGPSSGGSEHGPGLLESIGRRPGLVTAAADRRPVHRGHGGRPRLGAAERVDGFGHGIEHRCGWWLPHGEPGQEVEDGVASPRIVVAGDGTSAVLRSGGQAGVNASGR
jgi:hypothetical protein